MSNGHGEDTVGALLGRRLLASGVSVSAYPLVGAGNAYSNVRLLEPRRVFPSGGFGLRGSLSGVAADLRAGFVPHWRAQRAALAGQRGRHDVAVAIGDVYCLWMTALASERCVFVATAKSVHNEPHRWIERRIMRRAAAIWTRDEPTARALRKHGLSARFAGNPMMDAIPEPERGLPVPAGVSVVLLLPGSRADALNNLMRLLGVAADVAGLDGAAFVSALPQSLHISDVVRAASAQGWEYEDEHLRSGRASVLLTRDFGSALNSATVAVGLAGTANEQAAGRGKPVVVFPGDGAQYTRRFMRLQQRLLGDALIPTPDGERAAAAVVRLLQDPTERARRGEVGHRRMGNGGAVESVAQEILNSNSSY